MPAFRALEGSVLAIQDRKVRFSNPGVRDFLDRAVAEDRFVSAAVGVLSDYVELKQCWSIQSRTPERELGRMRCREWSKATRETRSSASR